MEEKRLKKETYDEYYKVDLSNNSDVDDNRKGENKYDKETKDFLTEINYINIHHYDKDQLNKLNLMDLKEINRIQKHKIIGELYTNEEKEAVQKELKKREILFKKELESYRTQRESLQIA